MCVATLNPADAERDVGRDQRRDEGNDERDRDASNVSAAAALASRDALDLPGEGLLVFLSISRARIKDTDGLIADGEDYVHGEVRVVVENCPPSRCWTHRLRLPRPSRLPVDEEVGTERACR